jgi:hypothetical protein
MKGDLTTWRIVLAAAFFLVAVVFILRSFYGMRVESQTSGAAKPSPKPEPVEVG